MIGRRAARLFFKAGNPIAATAIFTGDAGGVGVGDGDCDSGGEAECKDNDVDEPAGDTGGELKFAEAVEWAGEADGVGEAVFLGFSFYLIP